MQPANEQISEESRKFLLEVKKGRARKFVMFKDGVQIEKLIVFKAGTFDRVIRMARQDGVRGDEYWGMLDGDGTDIRFELSRAEGFVTPPGTEIRLKEFLREATGLKFEPTYVIVDKSQPIEEPDTDDEADERSDDAPPVDSSVSELPSVVAEGTEEKFIRLLKAILPHVKQALAIKTSLSDDLQAAVRDAQGFGKRREFEPGMAALRKVGELTKRALAEAESAAEAQKDTTSERTKSAKDTRKQQWDARLADIEPRYRTAVNGDAGNSKKLQTIMSYAQNQARQQQFVKALVGLDRLEQMLSVSS